MVMVMVTATVMATATVMVMVMEAGMQGPESRRTEGLQLTAAAEMAMAARPMLVSAMATAARPTGVSATTC